MSATFEIDPEVVLYLAARLREVPHDNMGATLATDLLVTLEVHFFIIGLSKVVEVSDVR